MNFIAKSTLKPFGFDLLYFFFITLFSSFQHSTPISRLIG
jgi:hypothetical protein